MKITTCLPLLLATSVVWSEEAKEALPEYGTQTDHSITVRADGEMAHPGIYHVRENITFSEFIELAPISRLANGRFLVSREVEGKKESVYIRYDREKKIFVPDLELRDGDYIFATFNMAKGKPIQPPQPKTASSAGSRG